MESASIKTFIIGRTEYGNIGIGESYLGSYNNHWSLNYIYVKFEHMQWIADKSNKI